jgi:hypothetical protein
MDAHMIQTSKKSSSVRAASLDSHGSVDELESKPIVLNQEDVQELDAQAQKYLDGRSSFPPNRDAQVGEPLRTSKYEHNLPSNSMQKIPHGTLPSSNNNENDPPSDLPVASDSDTPRTPIKGRMHLPGTIMPTKGHARRPGPVKGARSISDTFHAMGNQSPRLDSKDYSPASEPAIDWPDSDLPPLDPQRNLAMILL